MINLRERILENTLVYKTFKNLVSSTGRFVATEPVFSPDQRLAARLIIASDRGRYARDKDGYMNLLSSGFADFFRRHQWKFNDAFTQKNLDVNDV